MYWYRFIHNYSLRIIDRTRGTNINLIIETHSEIILRTLQTIVKKTKDTIEEESLGADKVAIYYVENENILMKGNVTLQREDSIMLGDELSIDLKTSSSKLTSKKNEKVRVKYNSEKID